MSTSERLHEILEGFRNKQLPEIETRAAKGDAEAQLTLGVLYANGRGVKADPTQATEWLIKAARKGVTEAATLLGWLFANGEGVPANAARALEYYRQAAEQGDSDAQCSLADLLLSPSQRPGGHDATAALRWYESAARQGHPKAQYMLGKLLGDGQWVEANDEAAFQWLTLAVMNGSEPAQKELQMLTARLGGVQVETFKQRMLERMQTTH